MPTVAHHRFDETNDLHIDGAISGCGDAAAYTHFRDRYRAMATSLGFEGHMRWAEAKPHSRRRPPEALKTLPRVGRSDRRQLNGITRLDHGAVPDDHRDVAVPHRQIAGP